jgi:type VI secretion system secreted protein VgrG
VKPLAVLLPLLLSLSICSFAQTDINLGTADEFAVLAGSGITNVSALTYIIGDVGSSPTPAVTGLKKSQVKGTLYLAASPVTTQAQTDLTGAYIEAVGAPCGTDLTGKDLGGMTLVPGVYCFSSSAGLTGALVLDAMGNVNAQWIFQIGSTLTVAGDSTVSIILNEKKHGAKPLWAKGLEGCNVYWQVGSSATIGDGTLFRGKLLALTSITLNGGVFHGKALARNGAVSMTDRQLVNGPPCDPPQLASFVK